MANKNMTFSASLRLNSKQFQKGIADVQRSIKSLQSSFLSLAGALGIGLSINRLGSEFMDTAVKLSTAQNVLKNVSKELGEYGENIVWLKKISNDYGQDLITLTNSFAQFRAAAASSSLSLEQMREIYESLARASGAYHLSADQTNGVMLAVTQMLSKGRVASEELRKQLGERLPGAFALMAQAAYNAGVITENSTSALEEAMKKGKVMAVDVLPSFAKVLNDVTENANFESLQTSITRMKNTFTELVEGANFEGMYQKLVDGANSTLKFFTDSFWPKVLGIGAGIFGGTVLTKGFKNFVGGAKAMANDYAAAFNAMDKKIFDSKDGLEKLGATVETFRRKKWWDGNGTRAGFANLLGGVATVDKEKYAIGTHMKQYSEDLKIASEEALKFNNAQLELQRNFKGATGINLISPEDIKRLKEANIQLKGNIAEFEKLNVEGKLSAGVFGKLSAAMKGFVGILKSALSSLAIGAIIGGITYLVSKIIEARKEAKRLAEIADGMVETVNKAGGENNKTLIQLTRIRKALEDMDGIEGKEGQRAALIGEVNKALGNTGDKLLTIKDDIKTKVIPAINDYINGIKEAARQQAILSLVNEKTARVLQLEAENAAALEDPNYGKTKTVHNPGGSPMLGGQVASVYEAPTREAKKLQDKIDKNNKEITELNKGIDQIIKMASEDTLKAIYGGKDTVTSGSTNNNNNNSGGKQTTPSSVMADYKKELAKLDNQFKAGSILASEYNESIKKLNQKTFEELSSFGWDKALKGIKKDDIGLANAIKEAAQKALLEGLDNPEAVEEFDAEMEKSAKEAEKSFREAWDRYLNYVKQKPTATVIDAGDAYMKSNRRGKGQTYSERDTYLNSKVLDATKSDISNLESFKSALEEALKIETSAENIERIKRLLDAVIDSLIRLKAQAADLKTKIDIATLEKEIIDLKKEGIDSVFNSITTMSNGMDNLYRAYQSIQQINDSTWKSEELENFLTYMNAIIQTMEVMKGLYAALNAVIKVHNAIKEKSAMKAIALNHLEATSEVEKGAASAGAAAAGGASSVASIPFVGPALAVAAVAAIVAAIMAGMSKFATGGIVGGAKSGDKNVIRANGGEAILTTSQQKRLLAIADGKTGTGGGKVEFKISGADLVGTLNNYNRLRR